MKSRLGSRCTGAIRLRRPGRLQLIGGSKSACTRLRPVLEVGIGMCMRTALSEILEGWVHGQFDLWPVS